MSQWEGSLTRRVTGSGIFSVPAFVLRGVGSPGAAMSLWVLAAVVSFAGLFIWVVRLCGILRVYIPLI